MQADFLNSGCWIRMLSLDETPAEAKILKQRANYSKERLNATGQSAIKFSSATFITNDVHVLTYQSCDRPCGILIRRQNNIVRYWQDGYFCRRATRRFNDFACEKLSSNLFFEGDRTRNLDGKKMPEQYPAPLPHSLNGEHFGGYDNIPETMIPSLLRMTRFYKHLNKKEKYLTPESTIMRWNEGLIHYHKTDIIGFFVLNPDPETWIEVQKIMKILDCVHYPIFIVKNETD